MHVSKLLAVDERKKKKNNKKSAVVRTHPSPVLGGRAGSEYSRAGEGGVEGVLDEDGDPGGDRGLHGLGVDHLGAEVG